jgi:tRNA pseudouridine55 synthase
LAVDKSAGMTSHDVVSVVRQAAGERRVGHAGTLDPMATGLMLVLVGSATRLERYLSGHDKRYDARIAFGSATDTLDAEGAIVQTADVPATLFDAEVAAGIIATFLGPSEQVPPAYSAIKTDGVAAHRRARAGAPPDLAPRPILVHDAQLIAADPIARTWDVAFHVSKGTYVRSLARDIGTAAGTVAHLAALRRTTIGDLGLEGALTLDEVRENGASGTLAASFLDAATLLGMPLRATPPRSVADGCPIPDTGGDLPDGTRVALVTDDRLLAVYRASGGILTAETVFSGGVSR